MHSAHRQGSASFWPEVWPTTTAWLLAASLLLRNDWGTEIRLALLMTLVFAIGARAIRAVTTLAAVTGSAVAFSLYLVLGIRGFFTLLLVFLLTWIATICGRFQKGRTQKAHPENGRDSIQVFANLYPVLVLLAILALSRPIGMRVSLVLIVGALAALSELACDTVSSEAGKVLSTEARLITNFQPVPAGTDGGITLSGTLLGILAAFLVAPFSLPHPVFVVIIGLSGTAGMLLDSILGATLERRGRLSNNMVNAISSGFAAALAMTTTYLAPGVLSL